MSAVGRSLPIVLDGCGLAPWQTAAPKRHCCRALANNECGVYGRLVVKRVNYCGHGFKMMR